MSQIEKFIFLYESGAVVEALRGLYHPAELCFDEIQSNSYEAAVLNFADSLVYGNPIAIEHTNLYLQSLSQDRIGLLSKLNLDYIQIDLSGKGGKTLGAEYENWKHTALNLMYRMERERVPLDEENQRALIQTITAYFQDTFAEQLNHSQNIIAYSLRFPDLYQRILSMSYHSFRPLYPLSYPSRDFVVGLSEKIPAIFMDPHDLDWSSILESFESKPALFLFWDHAIFQHCLQFPEVLQSVMDPAHRILILNLYPLEQLDLQSETIWLQEPLEPVLLTKHKRIHDSAEEILSLISGLPESADELYQKGKALNFNLHLDRLGKSRFLFLDKKYQKLQWADPYRDCTQQMIPLSPYDGIGEILAKENPIGERRVASKEGPLRLAHVTAQIVDGGHAPSRIVSHLLENHDQNQFVPSVWINEEGVHRPMEYPVSIFSSGRSEVRAPNRLREFEEWGVDVQIDDAKLDSLATARRLAEELRSHNVDVAVFHGWNHIHILAAHLCDVPLRVFFDHGGISPFSVFDFYVLSTSDSQDLVGEASSVVLPFPVSSHLTWEEELIPKNEFQVPDDALLMTTISNHLENRVSDEMVGAIAEICKRCPKAYYVPMGRIEHSHRFLERFDKVGIKDRVYLAGVMEKPSHVARSMDLYLNEFPFGSGLGILDAMASGTPVVSMYKEEGPTQGRYGGIYMGKERAITSCKVEDYVDLAVQLLTDQKMYQEWSEIAKERYRIHADVKGYVRSFEEAILDALTLTCEN